MRGWAFGLLHLRRDDFYRMREGEFWEALAAYRQEKEDDRRHSGELVRGAALRLFNLQLAPKDRILKSERFWPMPWDEDEEQANIEEIKRLDSLSDEEMKAEAAKFYKRLEKHTDGNK